MGDDSGWEDKFDPFDPWTPLERILHSAQEDGRTLDVWLRDDDAAQPSRELDQLTELARRNHAPVLLAVIPQQATADLADFLADEPLFTPAQHGFSHTNHAAPGERACEIGGDRPLSAVLDDLTRGRDTMATLFGAPSDILVPPWNRIAPEVLPHLSGLGFGVLSTFRDNSTDAPGVTIINPDLDIIDWRRGRRCKPIERLVTDLAFGLKDDKPVGILTHHKAHDERAWDFLSYALARLRDSGAVRFRTAAELRAGKPSPPL